MKQKLLICTFLSCILDVLAAETGDTISYSHQNIANSRIVEGQSTIVVSDVTVTNTGSCYILSSGTIVFNPLFSVSQGGILETGHGHCIVLFGYDNTGNIISRNKEFVEE